MGKKQTAAEAECFKPQVGRVDGGGVSPMHYWDWVGKLAERDYRKDDPL